MIWWCNAVVIKQVAQWNKIGKPFGSSEIQYLLPFDIFTLRGGTLFPSRQKTVKVLVLQQYKTQKITHQYSAESLVWVVLCSWMKDWKGAESLLMRMQCQDDSVFIQQEDNYGVKFSGLSISRMGTLTGLSLLVFSNLSLALSMFDTTMTLSAVVGTSRHNMRLPSVIYIYIFPLFCIIIQNA